MSPCDLLVIHPGAQHGIYGELGNRLTAIEPPLWARLLAGYCFDRGHDVRILDCEALGFGAERAAQIAIANAPRLVCLAVYGHQPSASTQQMTAAGAIARAIKNGTQRYIPIIMVGGHVSALPERTLREEAIDYVAIGEGPITVDRLLAGDSEGRIPGLGYRGWHDIKLNPPAPLMDLKDLNGQVWDLLPMGQYRAHNWQCLDGTPRRPYASVYTSLGCPYKCAFCCINAPFGTNRYRMRDPLVVAAEIVNLYHWKGIRTFKIVDEMFVLNERHYTAIAQWLVQSGISDDLNIWAYARVDTIKPQTLALLRDAGIRWLALGIESASAYVRDGADKNFKNADIVDTVRAVQKAGINVIANYIFGLPDDTMESMLQTLNLAMFLNTEWANFYSAMAYPGSRLYDEALATGATLPDSWRGYSQHNEDCRPLDTRHVSGAEVLLTRDQAFRAYFSNPLYQNMIERKFGESALNEVRQMLEYPLPRKLLETA